MRGRQALDIRKGRRRRFPVVAKQQKITDRRVVDLAGDSRVEAKAVQRVAENEPECRLGIVERLDAEMVPALWGAGTDRANAKKAKAKR